MALHVSSVIILPKIVMDQDREVVIDKKALSEVSFHKNNRQLPIYGYYSLNNHIKPE